MKIALDARLYSSSTGRVVREFLDRLPEYDSENEYYVLLRKKDMELYEPGGLNIHVVEADIPYYSFREQLELPRLLKSLQPDLTHFFMPQQPLLYKGKRTTMIHDLILFDVSFKKPLSGFAGLYRNYVKPFVFKRVIGRFISGSEVIITPSNYVTEQISSRFDPKEAVTIYNGTSPVTSEDPEPIPGFAAPFICFIGNVFPHKNLRTLIEALPLIRVHVPHLELLVVGKRDNQIDALEEWVKAKNIDGVRFSGFVSDEQLLWVYRNTKALVHPSFSEGFGLTGLEAMHEGTLVASSNATCLPEVYGESAHFFDPSSPVDIAEKVVQLLSDTELQEGLKAHYTKTLSKYSWDKMTKETLEILLKTAEQGSA